MSYDDLCQVQMTAPDGDWLVEFTRRLVTDRLAASAHNDGQIRSIYEWRGDLYDRPEFKATLHTRRSLVPAIVDRLDRDHPYEVPGVVALPLVVASEPYADWIRAQTQGDTSDEHQTA